MHPREVEVQQMGNEFLISGDFGPWELVIRMTRRVLSILILVSSLEKPDNINQIVVGNGLIAESRVFSNKPVCDSLMRFASPESVDDLPVMAIIRDCLQDDPLPVAFLTEALIYYIILCCYLFNFSISGLK